MTQSPAPLPPRESPATYTWFEAWRAALTRPSVATYTDLLLDPRASLVRAVAWLFVSALIAYLVGIAFQMLLFPSALTDIVREAGETAPPGLESTPGLLLELSLACTPFIAAFAVASYLAGFGLVHFVASALGSQGSYTQVVYAHAAYIAPLGMLTTLLGMVPLVNCLTLPLALYGFGLQLHGLEGLYTSQLGPGTCRARDPGAARDARDGCAHARPAGTRARTLDSILGECLLAVAGTAASRRIRIRSALVLRESDLEWHFVRGSGPGGQNVNKVATSAQVRFEARRHLPPDVFARLQRLAGRRLSQDGVLTITARAERTQERNRTQALGRLVELLRGGCRTPDPAHPHPPDRMLPAPGGSTASESAPAPRTGGAR